MEKSQILYISNAIKKSAVWDEYISFFPLLPLLIHMPLVINISSNCSDSIYNYINFYIIGVLLLTFISQIMYYIPACNIGHLTKNGLYLVIGKALLITLNFSAWIVIRAKPFKCLNDNFSQIFATIYFLTINSILLISSYFITKNVNNTIEVKSVLRSETYSEIVS